MNKYQRIAYYKAHKEELNIKKLISLVENNIIGKPESIKLICKDGIYKKYNYKQMLLDRYYICDCGCTVYSIFDIKIIIANREVNKISKQIESNAINFIDKIGKFNQSIVRRIFK